VVSDATRTRRISNGYGRLNQPAIHPSL